MAKDRFNETEWSSVREAPHWAAFAAMIAGASGVFSSLLEAFAVERALHQGAQHANALIREISSRAEAHAVDTHLRRQILAVETTDSAQWVHDTAISQVRAAMETVRRVSPEDAAEYSEWIAAVALRVANAAKEGSVLGFGGTRIGPREQQFLDELKESLQTP